jgi:polyhydroxyalkanoate synthase
LFLELVRRQAAHDPFVTAEVLAGLRAYERAERPPPRPVRRPIAEVDGVVLRDHGGDGPPAILIPSLINPPDVLDLDADVSLANAVVAMGRRALLLDWGPAVRRAELDISEHVESRLVPLMAQLDSPPALIGYCLGGTMALASASVAPCERVATLAAPWHFDRYPEDGRQALARMWAEAKGAGQALGALPMEVLQASFWSLDPDRTVAKFAEFGRLESGSPQAERFIALEDWANDGEALPLPAARELIEDFFGADLPGRGQWSIGGRIATEDPGLPVLHFVASRDRIAPAASAPEGPSVEIPSGHVGMVVGSARKALHHALHRFLDPALAASGGRG